MKDPDWTKLPPRKKSKETERTVQGQAIAAVSRITGVRCGRNNSGVLKDARGIPVTFGLGVGSPDVVGIITYGGPVGRMSVLLEKLALPPVAFAFGLEFKRPGKRPTTDQDAWHRAFERRGLRTHVCFSVDDAVNAVLEECRRFDAFMGTLT